MTYEPTEVDRPVGTVTLDFPREVGGLAAVGDDAPALYVIDAEGVSIRPQSATVDGRVVQFVFSPALVAGTYRVVVHPSRVVDTDGESFAGLQVNGEPFTGWTLNVLPGAAFTVPETPALPPAASFEVWVDGRVAPSGTGELSGPEIVVRSNAPLENLAVRVERVLPGATFSEYIDAHDIQFTTDGDTYVATIRADARLVAVPHVLWYGMDTEGTLPLTDTGLFPAGVAVAEAVEVEDEDDTYDVALDLPPGCVVKVILPGVEWHGYTRFVPLLVSAREIVLSLEGHAAPTLSPAALASVRYKIARASHDALLLWNRALPVLAGRGHVTGTMREYVTLRVQLWGQESAVDGRVTVRTGDELYSGLVDRDRVDRLRALAQALAAGVMALGPYDHDRPYATSAGLADDVWPYSYHPEPHGPPTPPRRYPRGYEDTEYGRP